MLEWIVDILSDSDLLQKYVLNGGVLMFILVPLSLVTVAAILQGVIVLRRGWVAPRWIERRARQAQTRAERGALMAEMRRRGNPLARVIWLTLKEFEASEGRPPRERIQAKLDDAIILVSDTMYDRLHLMATIYTVGPLLGLIGTILGLMDTFHVYGALDQPSVQMLAVGVQKALVTTLWGLSMAIPAYIAGQWMQKRIRAYERDILPGTVWEVVNHFHGPAQEEMDEANGVDRIEKTVLEVEGEA